MSKNQNFFLSGIVSILSITILFSISITTVYAQPVAMDFNQYYAFPLSLGIGYDLFLPEVNTITGYNFTFSEFSVHLRNPMPDFPWLQPGLKIGIKQATGKQVFTGRAVFDDMWDHTHLYGAMECTLDYRFSKYLEAAIYSSAGFSEAFFLNLPGNSLTDAPNPIAVPYLHAEAGLLFMVNPMYNFSIDLHPLIHYQQALGFLSVFDGFSFSFGASLHFRFGEDPDINRAGSRYLKISNKVLNPVFAAMQSYYVNNPAGTIRIENAQKEEIKNIEISFYQAGFMDNATPCTTLPLLKPGEKTEVALFASFNNEIFKTQGITPLAGEIRITYTYRGKTATQSEPVTYDLYDKNSLVWDDDRKIAAFITPLDRIIKNLGSYITQADKDTVLPYYNNPLQEGMGIYAALEAAECLYQIDPITPYKEVHKDHLAVDSINFPRDTLEKITGDCDDLTVLYLSLLETLGIETGFITVPGHIFPIFNTNVRARDYSSLYPDRELLLNIDGMLWIPVEITLLGNHDFLAAWKQGIKNYLDWEATPLSRRIYFTRQAQEVFRPVALLEKDYTYTPQLDIKISQGVQKNLKTLGMRIIEHYAREAALAENEKSYNRLGIASSIFREYAQAEAAYKKALAINSAFHSARRNLGNLYYHITDYEQALDCYMLILEYLDAAEEKNASLYREILIQVAVVHEAAGRLEKADAYYTLAGSKAPGIALSGEGNEAAVRSGKSGDALKLFAFKE